MTLSAEERASLTLARTPGIGPLTHARLLARFGSAEAAQAAIPTLGGAIAAAAQPSAASIARECEGLAAFGGRFLFRGGPGYPARLAPIPDPPPVLSCIGRADLFDRPCIAIVGARNASLAGRRMAALLAEDLGAAGFVIVSGLARGIDGAAHEAALGSGTLGVLAGGVDQPYPAEHAGLYAQMLRVGAVLSEAPLGLIARAQDFPRRNRIVAGLALGVVVVEAAARSGTLITARLALEQGRDVFAVPGSPLDPRAEGTNQLIRDGATLVRHAQDVIDALGGLEIAQHTHQASGTGLFEPAFTSMGPASDMNAAAMAEVRDLLGFAPTHRDLLLAATGLPPAQLADILVDLVLSGVVDETGGGTFALSAASASRASI